MSAPEKNVAVFCAAAEGARPVYRAVAEDLGRELAGRGLGVIYGGAHVGLMGALANAAIAAGGYVVGVIPHVLVDLEVSHEGISELHVVDTMHTRKALMGEKADAFVILPGGYGTFEELFEVLAWQTLKLHDKPVVLLNVEGFYDKLNGVSGCVRCGEACCAAIAGVCWWRIPLRKHYRWRAFSNSPDVRMKLMLLLHIPHARYVWLVAASMIAGVMNAMAGGGSFVSFPAMLGMGVPPVQANATNTVALWPGQLTSLTVLRHDLRKNLLLTIIAACLIGGITGAEILLHTEQRTFFRLVPWLILVGVGTFGASGPVSRWLKQRAAHPHAKERPIPKVALFFALLPVCFYIGYFGAGGGFMVMTILALFGMENMHELNALKVLAAMASNFVATVTFILMGAVIWHYCLISMVFAALGGWIGAKFAKRANGDVLRAMVVVTGCVIAAYFFWKQAHV